MADTLAEERRNRLLRRVDWRFLLDLEDEPRAVCFGDGELREALELVCASVARPGDAGDGLDLAVLVDPDASALAAAKAMLAPQGRLYAEWRRPLRGGAGRARRLLERAGYDDVRCHWPWPALGGRPPRFWLRLDSGAAAAAVLASRRRARVSASAVALPVLRRAAAAGLVPPLCAVAGPAAAGEDRSLLLLTGGGSRVNKVVGIELGPGPSAVLKFSRGPAGDEALEREAAVLAHVERVRPQLTGTPRVRRVFRRCGRVAVEESVLPGRPLIERLDRRSHGELAERVTQWLVELAGREAPAPRASWWERLVGVPLERFAREFSTVVEPAELERVRGVLGRLPDLPLVVEHRDCSPWNALLADDGRLGLADWESSEEAGLPLLDLVYFLEYAAQAAGTDPATAEGLARRCTALYCDAIGIDPAVAQPLRVLCWLVHTHSDYRRIEAEGGGEPAAMLGRSFFLARLREELARAERAS
ncbi:MAG TPA: phosphotransferase [Gaiellaceae bacterium]|nr:phosphotransferase [Gaiellaceae bacterium]